MKNDKNRLVDATRETKKRERKHVCRRTAEYFIGAIGTTTATCVDEQLNW